MLFNGTGQLLLVRTTYGDTERFALPGGGIRPWEQPHRAAEREVREEVGAEANGLALIATFFSAAEGKRDTIHLFTAHTADDAVADGVEIAEAAFFSLDGLPLALSPATARRIAEYRGERDRSGQW